MFSLALSYLGNPMFPVCLGLSDNTVTHSQILTKERGNICGSLDGLFERHSILTMWVPR
jgi:hypothetical protein